MLEIRRKQGGSIAKRGRSSRRCSRRSRASRVSGGSERGSRPGWIMPPSRYIRESIGRLRRPRVQPRAEAPSSLRQRVLVTPGRPPPCPAPSFPPAFGTAVDPPFPPSVVLHTECAGINVRSLYSREDVHAEWIHRRIRLDTVSKWSKEIRMYFRAVSKLYWEIWINWLDINTLKCAYVVYLWRFFGERKLFAVLEVTRIEMT